MASRVEFKDFSINAKAVVDDTTIAWLHEVANEVTSHAQRNCKMEEDAGKRLKGSYANVVDDSKGEAKIGTPLEEGYWEEWGTGEYAAHGDGRKGWWVYIRGQASQGGGQSYKNRQEAEEAAAFLRAVKGLDAVVTNGRRPNYTLENAFGAVKNPAIAQLERLLKERVGQ